MTLEEHAEVARLLDNARDVIWRALVLAQTHYGVSSPPAKILARLLKPGGAIGYAKSEFENLFFIDGFREEQNPYYPDEDELDLFKNTNDDLKPCPRCVCKDIEEYQTAGLTPMYRCTYAVISILRKRGMVNMTVGIGYG